MIKTLAVVGATGAVGQIVLEEIQQQKLQYGRLRLIASKRSAGKQVTVAGKEITVEALEPDVFNGVDVVIASTPDEVAAEFVPWAVERGAIVVDESAFYRMDPKCPWLFPKLTQTRLTIIEALLRVQIAVQHRWSLHSNHFMTQLV